MTANSTRKEVCAQLPALLSELSRDISNRPTYDKLADALRVFTRSFEEMDAVSGLMEQQTRDLQRENAELRTECGRLQGRIKMGAIRGSEMFQKVLRGEVGETSKGCENAAKPPSSRCDCSGECIHKQCLADRIIDLTFEDYKKMLRKRLEAAEAELETFRSGSVFKQQAVRINSLEQELQQVRRKLEDEKARSLESLIGQFQSRVENRVTALAAAAAAPVSRNTSGFPWSGVAAFTAQQALLQSDMLDAWLCAKVDAFVTAMTASVGSYPVAPSADVRRGSQVTPQARRLSPARLRKSQLHTPRDIVAVSCEQMLNELPTKALPQLSSMQSR